MFRPNRIGTPVIHNTDAGNLTTNAFGTSALTSNTFYGTNVNAAAAGNFTRSAVTWAPSATGVAANNKGGLGQWFVLDQPLNGNTLGVEINGALVMNCIQDTVLIPFLARLTSAPGAIMTPTTIEGKPTFFKGTEPLTPTGTSAQLKRIEYKENFVINGTAAILAAPYIHGIMVYTTTTFNVAFVDAQFSIRQLEDQDGIEYRDTRR